MSSAVEKILEQVKHLNSREQKEFWERIAVEEAKHLDEWEQEIERDSNAGKLDHLLAELKDDINAGRVKPLDEVINEPQILGGLSQTSRTGSPRGSQNLSSLDR